ncbi:MAG: T9SS type A sorting domain-containing protein [Flavobacteriales bacterium]|nr:T9SS type A sorting domain-containing protein [Flavobacteriales bacterium]
MCRKFIDNCVKTKTTFPFFVTIFLFLFSFNNSFAQIVTSVDGGKGCTGEVITVSESTKDAQTVTWDLGKDATLDGSKGTSERNIIFAKAGTYTITATVTDSKGSTKTYTTTVTVENCCDFNAVIITSVDTVCLGEYVAVSAQSQGTGFDYDWNFGGGSAASNQGVGPHYVYFSTTGLHTITLTVNETCSCNKCTDQVATKQIYVKPSPVISSLTSTASGCMYVGQNYNFLVNATSGSTISWYSSNGIISSSSNSAATVKWNTPGLQQLCVSATLDGCSAELCENFSIITTSCPTAGFNLPDSACQNQPVVILSTGNNGYGTSYSWSFTGSNQSSASTQNASVVFNSTGMQTVKLVVSKCGCASDSITKTIYIKPTPVANITGPSCGSIGQTYNFSNPVSPLSGVSYTWSFGGGNGTNPTPATAAISWSNYGSKEVCITVSKNGCSATDCNTIMIVDSICPIADFNLPDTVCQGEEIYVNAVNQGFGTNYDWTFEGGNPPSDDYISSAVSFSQVGDADVKLIVSKCGCDNDSLTKTVYVKQSPAASVTGANFGYVETVYTFYAPIISGASYSWTVDGGTIVGTPSSSISVKWSTLGYKSVCVNIMNSGGCSSDACFTIGIITNTCPDAIINGPVSGCVGDSLVFSATDQGCGVDYFWNIGGVSGTGLSNSVVFTAPGTYQVMLYITTCGCNSCQNDTAYQTITIHPVPTASINGPTAGFVNVNYTFTTPAQNGVTFSWSANGPASPATGSGQNFTTSWSTQGAFQVCLEASNALGCATTSCHVITISDTAGNGDTCVDKAVFELGDLGLNVDLDNKVIYNPSAIVVFNKIDPNNVVITQATSTFYVRNGVTDTNSYWSQEQYNTQSKLCYHFDQSLDGVSFSVFDLDYNNTSDYRLMECFGIEAYDGGVVVPITSLDYTLGSFVDYNSNTDLFCNTTGLVPNNSNIGDVDFLLTNSVDSICIEFWVQATDGIQVAPEGDIGISDIEHCYKEPIYCLSADLQFSDLGFNTPIDGQTIATGNTSAKFVLDDPNQIVFDFMTDDNYLRSALDTTALWVQDPTGAQKSQVCISFNHNTKDVSFDIYDLDFNDDTDFKLYESVDVSAYNMGNVASLTFMDYTLGSSVDVTGNTFFNKVGMVGSNGNDGDVSLHFSFNVDSVCLTFYSEGESLNTAVPNADLGISDITVCDIPVPVPVTWIGFVAQKQGDKDVHLSWTTGSEENNSHFEIERSFDGYKFEKALPEVSGAGTTSQISKYDAFDFNLPVGVVYYRIKQVDFDGNFEYSEVQAVQFYGENEMVVYPNPASDAINVEFEAGKNQRVTITNFAGQVIGVYQLNEFGRLSISTEDYPHGMYFIRAESKYGITTQKVVVNK